MAPALGRLHQLVAKNVNILQAAWKHIKTQLPKGAALEPIPVRAHQPIHPAAALKQSRAASRTARWYTTHARAIEATVRRYTVSHAPRGGLKYDRTLFPKSRTATAINGLTGRTPFASTLRPNLTGGALPRTAGGYSLGSGRIGGARYFSHTPATQAQVVQNVSQAVRSFLIGGQKAQFDGLDPLTGEKRYRAVTTLQDSTTRKMNSLPKATPGSYIQFTVNPTITALTPMRGIAGFSSTSPSVFEETFTLNTDGLLNILSADFSRALKDLAAVLHDLQTLSSLGDLPISYRDGCALRVHFPGCDADTVEALCGELGIRRGLVVQDADFDAYVGAEMALLFPFAPSESGDGLSEEDYNYEDDCYPEPYQYAQDRELYSTQSEDSASANIPIEQAYSYIAPTSSSPEDYGSLPHDSPGVPQSKHSTSTLRSPSAGSDSSPLEYHDFEGIYRFIEMCDDARGRRVI